MSLNFLAQVDLGKTPLKPGSNLETVYKEPSVLVNILVKNSIYIAGIILLCLVVFGSINLILNADSGNDPKSMQKNQQLIIDAIIGFVVVFAAYLIVQVIQVITGTHILD